MNTFSRHCIMELWECDSKILDNKDAVEELMVKAALESGAEVREVAFHKFAPQGVSGVVVISESHLAIHTFPEHGYASIDVFTCGERIDPQVAAKLIAKKLNSKRFYEINLERGMGEIAMRGDLNRKQTA